LELESRCKVNDSRQAANGLLGAVGLGDAQGFLHVFVIPPQLLTATSLLIPSLCASTLFQAWDAGLAGRQNFGEQRECSVGPVPGSSVPP
jgi:hypothetical protein